MVNSSPSNTEMLCTDHVEHGNDLEIALAKFNLDLVKRNDPFVKTSTKLLWLMQGETRAKRVLRSVILGGLDIWETVSGSKRAGQRYSVETPTPPWVMDPK